MMDCVGKTARYYSCRVGPSHVHEFVITPQPARFAPASPPPPPPPACSMDLHVLDRELVSYSLSVCLSVLWPVAFTKKHLPPSLWQKSLFTLSHPPPPPHTHTHALSLSLSLMAGGLHKKHFSPSLWQKSVFALSLSLSLSLTATTKTQVSQTLILFGGNSRI